MFKSFAGPNDYDEDDEEDEVNNHYRLRSEAFVDQEDFARSCPQDKPFILSPILSHFENQQKIKKIIETKSDEKDDD